MRQEARVNPILLRWARESINMDLEEAAERIGVDPDRLLEWETGARRPTINQARAMSRVYRRPLAAFYLPRPPEFLGFSVPHDFRRFPTDRPRELSPELVSELRRIEYLRDAAIELAEEVPQAPRRFVASTRLGEPAADVAKRAIGLLHLTMEDRAHWRTAYDALNGWRDAVERTGVLIMHLRGVDVEEVRGIVIAKADFPLIAVNGKDSANGRIFTLLHEFVHLMLGATGMSNMRLARHPRTEEQTIEQFCNGVTGEVLVPCKALLSHKEVRDTFSPVDWSDETLSELAQYFHVSREVIVRRLVDLRRASRDFYRRKRQEYQKEREEARPSPGGRLPISRRIIRSVGQPFARIALEAYYREVISSSDLAELLGARVKHLPAVEECLAGSNALTGGDW